MYIGFLVFLCTFLYVVDLLTNKEPKRIKIYLIIFVIFTLLDLTHSYWLNCCYY